MNYKIAVLPGDGIGPEVMDEGTQVLEQVAKLYGFGVELEYGIVGGASIDAHGKPLTVPVLNLAKQSDAVLLGAMGGLAVFQRLTNKQFHGAVSILLVVSGIGLLARAL